MRNASKLASHVTVIYDFSELVNFLFAGEALVLDEALVVFVRIVFQLLFSRGLFGFRALAVIIGINVFFSDPTRVGIFYRFQQREWICKNAIYVGFFFE